VQEKLSCRAGFFSISESEKKRKKEEKKNRRKEEKKGTDQREVLLRC